MWNIALLITRDLISFQRECVKKRHKSQYRYIRVHLQYSIFTPLYTLQSTFCESNINIYHHMYNIRTQTGKCKTIYNIITDIFWGDNRKDRLSFPHRQNAEKNVFYVWGPWYISNESVLRKKMFNRCRTSKLERSVTTCSEPRLLKTLNESLANIHSVCLVSKLMGKWVNL